MSTATICPTVTPDATLFSFDIQLKRVLPFAERIHIDVMDGVLAKPKSIMLGEVYWPANRSIDLHIMYQRPSLYLRTLVALAPRLVIIHAEAEGDFMAFSSRLHQHGVEVGVALLPETPVSTIEPALEVIDHVLIFSGHLGQYGGVADMGLLVKARQLRALKPSVEIGWDGGINASNVRQLIMGGVDVLNVGGYIQHATNPAEAYATLKSLT